MVHHLFAGALVAHGPSRGTNAARQGGVRDDPAAPDRRNQIVLADDVIAVLDQINQQVEHLRLDGNEIGAAAQFAPPDIKSVTGNKLHVAHEVLRPDCNYKQRDKAISWAGRGKVAAYTIGMPLVLSEISCGFERHGRERHR